MIGVQDLLQEQRWGHRELSLSLFGTDRLHVKGGVPEHHDSGLLLALQPSPCGFVHGIVTWQTSDG